MATAREAQYASMISERKVISNELESSLPKPSSAVTSSTKSMDITLRPYQLSDVDDFMEWANNEKVIRDSRLRHFTSKLDAQTYLNEVAIPHPWYKAICYDNRPIGFISFTHESDYTKCRGLISYALGSKYWGKGITTLAVKMLVSSVFKEFPDLERVEGYVDVENKASQRVLEKVGFVKEGVLRKYIILQGKKTIDCIMYSLLSTDPFLLKLC